MNLKSCYYTIEPASRPAHIETPVTSTDPESITNVCLQAAESRLIASGEIESPWPDTANPTARQDQPPVFDEDRYGENTAGLPNFRDIWLGNSDRQGALIGVFLASFIPVRDADGDYGVDASSRVLANCVVRAAPTSATVGCLSRLGFGVLVPSIDREGAEAAADAIRDEAKTVDVALRTGEATRIAAVAGVVLFDEVSVNDSAILDRVAWDAEIDMSIRYPQQWRYKFRIY